MGRRSGTTASRAPRHIQGHPIQGSRRATLRTGAIGLAALVALTAACSSVSSAPVVIERSAITTNPELLPSDSVPSSVVTTTHPPTTTWHPVAPCTVSALLVPSCGAWLGASTPSRDATYDYVTGLAEYEQVAQNPPDIMHFYKKDATQFPSAEEIALSERPGEQRSILFYNWKPSTRLSWREVADGGADAGIVTVADGLKHYDHTLFLAIWHEPENDQRSKGTPEDYVAMYRHVVELMRQVGVTNVVYVMNYMGFAQWRDVVDDFYPGDDVVDWIAYDPYGFEIQTDFGLVLNTAAEDWPGFYAWVTAKAPDKPIMIGEWGVDLRRQPDAAAILDGAVTILENDFPQIKALVYWNDYMPPNGVVVRLDEPTDLGREYGDAYRRFAQSEYFNSTDPARAP